MRLLMFLLAGHYVQLRFSRRQGAGFCWSSGRNEPSGPGGFEIGARDTVGLTAKLIGPIVRGGARGRADVPTHCALINSPLQRLVGKRGYPVVSRSANSCRQITGFAGD